MLCFYGKTRDGSGQELLGWMRRLREVPRNIPSGRPTRARRFGKCLKISRDSKRVQQLCSEVSRRLSIFGNLARKLSESRQVDVSGKEVARGNLSEEVAITGMEDSCVTEVEDSGDRETRQTDCARDRRKHEPCVFWLKSV